MNMTYQRLNSEKLLEILSLSDNATAIYTGADIVIQSANEAMLKFLGKDKSIIGMRFAEAVPELVGQPFIGQLQEVWSTGKTYSAYDTVAELMINGKLEKSYFDFKYRAIKNDNGEVYCILHTATDVTERFLNRISLKEIQIREQSLIEELAASNEELTTTNEELLAMNDKLSDSAEEQVHARKDLEKLTDTLQQAMNSAQLGIWSAELVTGKLTISELGKQIHGIADDKEISLEDAKKMIDPDFLDKIISTVRKAINSDHNFELEYIIFPADGSKSKWLKCTGKTYFNPQNKPAAISGIIRDITEQKQDELRKNDFIGMVSHELKTPLTSLKGYVQLLLSKSKKQEDSFAVNALSKVEIQVSKMTAMINGFLNLSRLESGKIHLQKQDFDIDVLIEEIIDDARITTINHIITLHPCEKLIVNADRDKIGQVISNLLSNAVKYSPKGRSIEVNCHLNNEMAEISIKDEGMGIKPQDVDKLFERYYRIENKHTEHISGFGIGLYLCSEIVVRHKGKIWVESQSGVGSTFYFNLPLSTA
ncbi:PAS domain-containing sensor histidine kinase [Pedobacter metabolipauper]|uniref:histidine kinase n=1 Tax=Pedobacter metabolipauper TaxID=425513 RepID=A0A4R6SZI9_9SPHI|nr:ATP-binding protein [Pedobacter metabolipauper]TDQ11876.1 PAS/PAC sensor signal transduction histidine kinase [Pedobacter metabolipauper]